MMDLSIPSYSTRSILISTKWRTSTTGPSNTVGSFSRRRCRCWRGSHPFCRIMRRRRITHHNRTRTSPRGEALPVNEDLVNLELRRRCFREVLIHTGQHYDYEMSQAFFECFDLPAPDHHFQLPNNDGVSFSARAIPELAAVFATEKPDCVLAYGDVNS